MALLAAHSTAPTIEANGLSKRYGSEKRGLVHALAGLDLIAPSGKVTVLGGNTELQLGHTTTWFVVRAIVWSIVIFAIFSTLATRRFSKL